MKLIVAYIAMLIFDAGMFFGTYYGVNQLGWSAWSYLLMLLLVGSSAPKLYGITSQDIK